MGRTHAVGRGDTRRLSRLDMRAFIDRPRDNNQFDEPRVEFNFSL